MTVHDPGSGSGRPVAASDRISLTPEHTIGVWRVEKQLGKGGMGSVYRCHNRHAPRIKAAIKLLDPALMHQGEARARFVREAEILFALDHPHIVNVSSVDLDSTPPYLEMEFVEGASLEQELARRGALPVPLALSLAEQLASAVAYLHRCGVYHRDIKPMNVLIRPDGTLKLVDFGLAVEAAGDRITMAGSAFGTPAYAPPEWIDPVALDPMSWDTYAMGVVLFEMLTGSVAFPVPHGMDARRQMVQVMAAKRERKFLDPARAFPDDLRRLVRDLTRRDPHARLNSAREALIRLQGLERPEEAEAPAREDADDIDDLWREVVGVSHDRSAAVDEVTEVDRVVPAEVAAALRPRRSMPWLLAGVAALVAVFVVGAVGVGGAVMAAMMTSRPEPAAPAPRTLHVVLAGVPTDLDARVEVAGSAPSDRNGFEFVFPAVPIGEAEVRWAVGSVCGEADCPGSGCAAWCAQDTRVVEVPAGEGVFTTTLGAEPPARRDLVLELPDLGSVAVRVHVDGDPVAVDGGVARRPGLRPGLHQAVVAAGSCPEGDACPDGPDACPAGCAVWRHDLVLPNDGQGPFALTVPTEALQSAVAVRRPAPAPAPAAARPPAGTVTKAAFATWLADHPEWSREAAIAAGKADDTYQRGWVDGVPPGKGSEAVVNVSWWAAEAYCRTRGGVLAVDAGPLQWDESPTQPLQEWRVDAGDPAWRRFDGAESRAGRWDQSNSFTGFRCAG